VFVGVFSGTPESSDMPMQTNRSPAWALKAAVVFGVVLLFQAVSYSATKVGAGMATP